MTMKQLIYETLHMKATWQEDENAPYSQMNYRAIRDKNETCLRARDILVWQNRLQFHEEDRFFT